MTRLSAKQLRSYDAAGLLAPARVDPHTGYRLYHPAQVRTAITIAMLRSLDVPLPVIADLLVAGEDEARRLLDAERRRLADRLAAQERTLRTLGRLTGGEGLMPYDVATAAVPALRLLALRGTSTAERLHHDAAELAARVLALVPGATAPDAAPAVGLYPVDLDGAVAFAVGVEAAPGGGDDAPLPGGLVRIDLPAGRVARVVHEGPHDELGLAYFPLLAWLRERGHEARTPVVERYLDDPAETVPERLRTEVSIALPADLSPDDATP